MTTSELERLAVDRWEDFTPAAQWLALTVIIAWKLRWISAALLAGAALIRFW